MVLKSTNSPLFHPSNQPDSFRLHLSQPLDLKGVWTVSLLEFTINTWQTKHYQWNSYLFTLISARILLLEIESFLNFSGFILESQNIIYQNPCEVAIKLRQFQDVHVYIRDAKNAPASFLSGEVTVTLLLRRLPFL